MILQVIVEQF